MQIVHTYPNNEVDFTDAQGTAAVTWDLLRGQARVQTPSGFGGHISAGNAFHCFAVTTGAVYNKSLCHILADPTAVALAGTVTPSSCAARKKIQPAWQAQSQAQ